MSTMARSRTKRAIYLGLGIFMLAIGIVGVWLPLIPTTGPVLLAAWCFARSSERFDQWMLNHRVFGPIVRDWRSGAGFTVRAKVIAVIALAVTFGVSIAFVVDNLGVRIGLAALGLALAVFIVSRPTKPRNAEPDPAAADDVPSAQPEISP
ncbi:MAG TPA: YbaN family protein [Acidimicrobiia bacterium]|jgi:hypothetical protein|nr:YbaN family protein [Acidimicrobiia bacterium]